MQKFLSCFALRAHSAADSYRLRWWITFTVMLVAAIDTLDLTIVTVSLPEMMGSLSANIDQISWVLTSYSIASAIMMPLTGLLVARIGYRKLLLTAILGFMLSSILCASAHSLAVMVSCRIAQGLFGAVLIPMSQCIIRTIFPKKDQGLAMAVWSIGILCAPVFGPVLGGYITTHLSWQWIFYINVPICLLSFGLSLRFIRETALEARHVDWLGLILMVTGIAALQCFLDRGNSVNWFDSTSSVWLTLIFSAALVGFFWRCWQVPHPIIHLHLFKDRNFAIYTLLNFLFSLLIFGQITQAPLMVQTLFHYSNEAAGLLMVPRGLGAMLIIIAIGPFIKHSNAHVSFYAGLGLAIISTFMLSRLSLDFSVGYYIVYSSLQGMSMGLYLLPVAAFSLVTLTEKDIAEGSGLASLSRGVGVSIGISLMATLLTRGQQSYWYRLAESINIFNPNLAQWLHTQAPGLAQNTFLLRLAHALHLQADMLAFNNVAWFTTCGLVVILPLIILLKKTT